MQHADPSVRFSRTIRASSQHVTVLRATPPGRPHVKSTYFVRCGLAVAIALLSGCSLFHFHRSPHPAAHVTGNVSVAPVSDFVYLPAVKGHVSENRIANTAVSGIVMKSNINAAVHQAVLRDLNGVGVHTGSEKRVLSATIVTFVVDDIHAPAIWTLKMRYVVTDVPSQQVIYESTRTVEREAAKFTNTTLALDDIVKLSINELVADSAFIKAIN